MKNNHQSVKEVQYSTSTIQQEQQEVTNVECKKKNESLSLSTIATSCYNNTVKCLANNTKSDLTARIISGSIGSLMTSLVVTPLEVVKIRIQASTSEQLGTSTLSSPIIPELPNNIAQPSSTNVGAYSPTNFRQPCPRGCGTFVLYNGHMDCVLSKSWVSYFDPYTGKLKPSANISSSTSGLNPPGTATLNKLDLGTFAMLRRIFLDEGFNGLYAGLRPTLVMAIPNTVLYFSAYEEIVWRLRQYYIKMTVSTKDSNNHGHNDTVAAMLPLLAGGSARLISSTVTAPLELLRTRQAAETGTGLLPNQGMWQEFKYIIQNEGGIRSLYKGLRPTLYRDVPFSAIYWLCIEQFRNQWKKKKKFRTISPLEQAGQAFVNGVVAGTIAAACTTPFDVIKTRQQARSVEQIAFQTVSSMCHNSNGSLPMSATESVLTNTTNIYSYPLKTNGSVTMEDTWSYLRYVARTEGVSALWRGNQARMLKVAPSCAIMISTYELGKRLMEQEN